MHAPGYNLAMGYFSPREIKQNMLRWCVFIIFCIKIALVTYLRPHGIIFAPLKVLEKKDNMYVHFRRVFAEFVALLTKIWFTNSDF